MSTSREMFCGIYLCARENKATLAELKHISKNHAKAYQKNPI